MADIRLERDFPVTPARLFEVISTRAELIRWWGHDGWTITDEQMDFSKPGPWFAEMHSEEGNRYKMSGHVTRVSPPNTIGFTWGWHDPDDLRGDESHVIFTVLKTDNGAKLVVDHCDLATDDGATQHENGWGATLGRLVHMLNETTDA